MGHIVIGKRTVVAKTCLICGEFKMGSDFALMYQRYRDSYCRVCHNSQAMPVVKNHQQKTLREASRHRKPWSRGEVDKLKEMAANGLSGPQMALTLGRTMYSVYTMKNKLDRGMLDVQA